MVEEECTVSNSPKFSVVHESMDDGFKDPNDFLTMDYADSKQLNLPACTDNDYTNFDEEINGLTYLT